MHLLRTVTVISILILCSAAQAETVDVKYRGPVDLKPFTCTNTVSSFVRRVCYDKAKSYMLILLNSTWYHYCEIDSGTVAALTGAESVGRFFNANIKGRGKDGPFDCRTHDLLNTQAVFFPSLPRQEKPNNAIPRPKTAYPVLSRPCLPLDSLG